MTPRRYLYLLSEGEQDELFYERVCERLSGFAFDIQTEYRARRGSNFKTVLQGARMLLNRYKRHSERQEIVLVIALDNDRAPGHPGGNAPTGRLSKTDRKKENRYAAVVRMVNETLGADPDKRPVDVAVAIPVEMIESWLLPLVNPELTDLPLFAEACQHSARDYHGGKAPPQLKDLRDAEATKRGMNLEDLFLHAADEGDLDHLAGVSRSFAMFAEQVRGWRV